MNGFVSGVSTRFSFAVTWMLAAAVGLGAASIFLLPKAAALGLAQQLTGLNATNALIFTLAAASAGVATGALAAPLYRVLEGYALPTWLQERGIDRQKEKWRSLERKRARTALQQGLLLERRHRYPATQGQFAPTGFGNAMRAFETYAFDRYKLDSQTLWTELLAVSPKALQDEVGGARVGTDFFVALFYWTAFYGLAAFGIAAYEQFSTPHKTDWPMIVQTLVLVVGPILTYRGAVATVRYQSSTVRAMVNLGRPKLAEAFGLTMPSTVREEQELWDVLGHFVRNRRDDTIAVQLDAFRVQAKPKAPTARLVRWTFRRFRGQPATEEAKRLAVAAATGEALQPSTAALRRAMGGMVMLLVVATAALVLATLLPQAVGLAAATLLIVGVIAVLTVARVLLF